jgi:hypothetical protein
MRIFNFFFFGPSVYTHIKKKLIKNVVGGMRWKHETIISEWDGKSAMERFQWTGKLSSLRIITDQASIK